MKLFAALLVASVASTSMASVSLMGLNAEMKDMLNTYNLYATCLGPEFAAGYMMNIQKAGEYCMAQEVPAPLIAELSNLLSTDGSFSLAKLIRSKRQVDIGLSEQKVNELTSQVTEHKLEMLTVLGNFSCALTQMGILTEDGEINMDMFTFDAAKEFLGNSLIGEDDEAIRAMSTGIQDCNEVATAWPESTLERNPLMKAFGRRKVFLTCMLKVQDGLCYKRQLYEGLKAFQKLDTAEVDLGIPGNKFDQAAGAWQVMMHHGGPEMKMINDFFWTRSNM